MPVKTDWRGHLTLERRSIVLGIPLAVWAAVILSYFFLVPRLVPPLYLPGPEVVARAACQLGWTLPLAALYTALRAVGGFLVGSILGVAVALTMFRSQTFRAALHSPIEALRPLPPVALTLFIILWFKLHWLGQLILISLGCFMVLVVSAHEALANLNINLLRAARSLGATGRSYYSAVLIPAILPDLVAPLRVSLALAFAVTIAAEFMGVQTGLGYHMQVARTQLDTGTIVLGLIILTLEAGAIDWSLRRSIRRFTHWRRLS